MSVLVCAVKGCNLDPGHAGTHVPWSGFKYATPRDVSRKSDGPRVAKLAAILGKPGMPWQRDVWDVALERDAFGQLVYEIVIVTVPRQSGKTTLYGPVQLDRVMTMPRIKTFYTAQTGKDARSRFNDLVALVRASPLSEFVKFRYSAGDEAIAFPNESALKIFAPVAAALHGETPPLVGLDEIWELTAELGHALVDDAIIPAQITLGGQRQLWLFSTFGTDESTFLWEYVDLGRESVEKPGTHPRVAYFEAGLPDDADPYDPRAIAAFHPAVGHTQTVSGLLAAAAGVSRATWLRAFCNVRTEVANPLFTKEHVAELEQLPEEVPSTRDVAISYADQGGRGVVMASWRDVDQRPTSRVLHSAPGSVWMHDLIAQLVEEWRPAAVGAFHGGATKRLTDKLEQTLGPDVITTIGPDELSTACMGWLTDVDTNLFKHDGTRTIAEGTAHLVTRTYGTGQALTFDLKASTGTIAGPLASAVGVWLYDHAPAPAEALVIHTS